MSLDAYNFGQDAKDEMRKEKFEVMEVEDHEGKEREFPGKERKYGDKVREFSDNVRKFADKERELPGKEVRR